MDLFNRRKGIFKFWTHQDAQDAWADITTDIGIADTPTSIFDNRPSKIKAGIIKRIYYHLDFTGVETYTLRLWSHAIANNYTSIRYMLYESPALQADNMIYDRPVEIPFILNTIDTMYYGIDSTGALGNSAGTILVTGKIEE